MYRLQFSRLPGRPEIRQVTPQEIQRISSRSERRGFFEHNGDFSVPSGNQGRERLVVTFNPTIYLANNLTQPDRQDVQAHEMDHFEDLVIAAQDLQRHLTVAVRTQNWNQLWAAWEWFNYYVGEDALVLHRNLGRATVRMNRQPGGQRPYRPSNPRS